MLPDNYILDKYKMPVKEPDLIHWARWMEKKDRIVKQEMVGDVKVSTVFLGIDHNFSHEGPPILWETMVFGGPHDQEWMDRCSGSIEQAEAMHERMVERVKNEKTTQEIRNSQSNPR